jgi:hypothetical protein
VCSLAYNGDSATGIFIILTPLPGASTTATGWQVYSSNDTFVVPSDVYKVKVTCIGGGGGGTNIVGGNPTTGGGGGGTGIQYFSVSPTQAYNIIVGAGGSAGGGTGGEPRE